MQVYRPGDRADLPLLHWYAQLVAADDLAKLVGPSLFPLAAFLRHFTDPRCVLFYEADAQGWWIAAWVFPLMGGGTWGLWLRPDKRAAGSRRALAFIVETLHAALTLYPVLVNTTKQDDVVAKTKRLGYTYLGRIPYLFEGEPCHVLYLTREAFAPLAERWSRYNERRQS
jgi:hypothetical protein